MWVYVYERGVAPMIIQYSTRESLRTPVPVPSGDEFEGADRDAYEWVTAREARKQDQKKDGRTTMRKTDDWPYYGQPFVPFWGSILNSPRMAKVYCEIGTFFIDAPKRGSFSAYEVEFVDLVVCRHLGNDVPVVYHAENCVANGGDPEVMRAVWRGEFDLIPLADRQLVDFIIAVCDGMVSQPMWDRMEDRMGRKVATEFAGYVCYKLMSNRCQQALGPKEPAYADLERFFEALCANEVPLPDARRTNVWTEGED
jgi:hypothetical protein